MKVVILAIAALIATNSEAKAPSMKLLIKARGLQAQENIDIIKAKTSVKLKNGGTFSTKEKGQIECQHQLEYAYLGLAKKNNGAQLRPGQPKGEFPLFIGKSKNEAIIVFTYDNKSAFAATVSKLPKNWYVQFFPQGTGEIAVGTMLCKFFFKFDRVLEGTAMSMAK